ncbi:hypothetical protein Tdes44962_MAKER04481 [Teratosphaeria destructans]|uniref:Uncharacterized protein n=1 Tax=Teratosphaeria destructans TaxID=418781 RepID=A0A9W7VZU5_9PEZI|nr:hypothetical protein Tdes44962_MAKER04481 [Teratosphaeria destructans]
MCPPGVDQTTRTPQRWYVVSPANQQSHALFDGSRYIEDVKEFLQGGESWDAFRKLAKPSTIARNTVPLEAIMPQTTQLSPIEGMPAEIMSMILEDPALTREDRIAFGISSKTLWTHLLSHAQQDARRSLALWADTPLICTGTWLEDLPETIYTAYPNVRAREQEYLKKSRRSRAWYGPCPSRGWNYRHIRGGDDTRPSCQETWLAAYEAVASETVPESYRPRLQETLAAASAGPAFWTQRDWILRNKTTKQFFRVEVDQPQNGQEPCVHVRSAPWLSLDRALLLRVCWGVADWESRCSRTQERNLKLARGEWAGHCFDVVEDLSFDVGQWRDVTKEIKEEGATCVPE